jgi:pyridoxine 4-dehydrogenase
MLDLCAAEGIAWVPFFPLGSAFPGRPKVTDQPAVVEAARALGATPSQVGLAWLRQHAPNVLLISGTSSIDHLRENVAAGELDLPADLIAHLEA